jgi:hypothetical protein
MSKCTAPVRGHRTPRARAACPACGGYRSFSSSPTYSAVYKPPPASSSGTFVSAVGDIQTVATKSGETASAAKPPLDKGTALGLAGIAAVLIGIVALVVAVFWPDQQEAAPTATKKTWDAPSQGFLDALALAGVTPADETSAENFVAAGNSLCERFAQPQANKEDLATVVRDSSKGQLNQAQAEAMVEAANRNLCPAAVVPATAPLPVRVPNAPNVPNVPNPPNISNGGGGGGGNGGESRFCRKRRWC